MFTNVRRLAFIVLAAALTLSAADPFIGTWKMNPAKSKYTSGDAPKSSTMTYSQDGDWVVGKLDSVTADGKAQTSTNRYKRDGKEYPYSSPTAGTGTITVKAVDANSAEATIKTPTSAITIRSVVAKDGKSMQRTVKGTDPQGKPVSNVALFEKQ